MRKNVSETIYSVKVLRSGQPLPYADTEREFLITVQTNAWDGVMKPYVRNGDVEARIAKEAALRAEGRLLGGPSPETLRQEQREWAKGLLRTLCQQRFREKGDFDGQTGMGAHFYPTLKSLVIDPAAGTIRALIVEPYTD